MARKRRGNDNQPIGVGMTAKQAKRRNKNCNNRYNATYF